MNLSSLDNKQLLALGLEKMRREEMLKALLILRMGEENETLQIVREANLLQLKGERLLLQAELATRFTYRITQEFERGKRIRKQKLKRPFIRMPQIASTPVGTSLGNIISQHLRIAHMRRQSEKDLLVAKIVFTPCE